MKKTLSVFLLAALMFSLCAWGQQSAEAVTQNTVPETAAPQEASAVLPETPPAETSAAETEETVDDDQPLSR